MGNLRRTFQGDSLYLWILPDFLKNFIWYGSSQQSMGQREPGQHHAPDTKLIGIPQQTRPVDVLSHPY
jgi:hypothetical protein